MFDHLVRHQHVYPRKKIPVHHHGIVFLIVVSVLSTVIGLNLTLYQPFGAPVTKAEQPNVSVRLVDSGSADTIVGPFENWHFGTIEMQVTGTSPAALRSLSFLLDGTYDARTITAISLYHNGTQVGLPVTPNDAGMVAYTFGSVLIQPGKHMFTLKMTISELTAPSYVFRIVVNPESSIVIDKGTLVEMKQPYASSVFSVVDRGSIGSFVHRAEGSTEGNQLRTNLYLYGVAEDFRLLSLSFESSTSHPGVRLDIFADEKFIGSASFIGTDASLSFDDTIVRVLRNKNTVLTLLVTGVQVEDIPELMETVRFVDMKALGLKSQQTFVSEPSLSLL